MLKLNIGCGLKYKKDYINVDAYDDTIADEIMSATDLRFEDLSVDLIECFQVIEHLGYMNTILALGEFFRVLNTNSSIIIETPDIDKTFEIYLKKTVHAEKAVLLNWIFGVPPKDYEHKFCFPAGLLRKLLIEAGFVDIMENYHDKSFGMPSYNFIAKKPLAVNNNYLLVHNFRKRAFKELEVFNSIYGANFQLDFEKNVLGLTVDFKPRDFSVMDLNKIFSKSVIYSTDVAQILVEECLKLSIINQEFYDRLFNIISKLEEKEFIKKIYSLWNDKLVESNDPEESFEECLDYFEKITDELINSNSFELMDKFFEEIHLSENSLVSDKNIFSYYYVESILSRSLAKFIKGTANELEISLCNALITNV